MRDMDAKGRITGDFIAVYGDVVANIPLQDALAAHRARREKDKKALMTMVLREAGQVHRTKSPQQRRVFVLDPDSHRCVHYEQLRPGETAVLDIPGDVLEDHVELEVREDLIDCGIDICTQEVLAQYTDNFDWQLPRRGFLYGTLKDFETYQYTVHTHVVTKGYAARIISLRAFDAISMDMMGRWTYPLTPDFNILPGQSFKQYSRNVYLEDGSTMARTTQMGHQVILGADTTLGEHSAVTNSVIGRRCIIGARAKIDGAHIWDGARIGDDAVIEKAIIGNDAVIGNGCHVKNGALIGDRVHISDGITVSGKHRITRLKRKRGMNHNEIVEMPADPQIVGPDGTGFHMEIDEEEEEVLNTLVAGVQDLSLIDDDSISSIDEDSDDDLAAPHMRGDSARSDSFASAASDESGETRQKAKDFHQEAVHSMVDDMAKGNSIDDMKTEFKALILGVNADDTQIQRVTATAFSKRLSQIVEAGKTPKEAVSELIPTYTEIITAYVSSKKEQAAWLLYLQSDLVHRKQGSRILLYLSNALAQDDTFEPDGFELWWNDARSSASEEMVAVRKDTEPLVDALCASDEEESEEDSDDDDDDGDDNDDDD